MSRGDFFERIETNQKRTQIDSIKVAMDLNITREALSHYENDKREPSIDMLIKMSEYYDVSIDFLINGKEFKN